MKYSIYLFSFFLLFNACNSYQPPLVCEIAQTASLPEGGPSYSDVCLSSRWERPRNEQDTLDTFKALETFHATRLNWIYTTNPAFIKKVTDAGYTMQVSITPTIQDLPIGSGIRAKGRVTRKDGSLATAPWMNPVNSWWGCVNHPDFQASYWEHLRIVLEAGANDIQVDDPGFAAVMIRNEWEDLCYCKYCIEAKDEEMSPLAFQEKSVLAFHKKMKQKAEAFTGRHVPFSCNNFRGDWELFPHGFFDYGIAEAPVRRGNPEYIYASLRETRKRGKAQVYSFVSDKSWLVHKVLASTYASGGNLLVPWDVWQGGGKPRFFAKKEEFSNYYGFIHSISDWLEGYEDAFYHNTQMESRFLDFEKIPLHFEEYRRNTHAYIRAKPNKTTAPVVVHLVDWEIPVLDSFEIRLNEAFFFKSGISSLELIEPVPFDEENHQKAISTKDFSDFKSTKNIEFQRKDDFLVATISKLEYHWGLLIVKGMQ